MTTPDIAALRRFFGGCTLASVEYIHGKRVIGFVVDPATSPFASNLEALSDLLSTIEGQGGEIERLRLVDDLKDRAIERWHAATKEAEATIEGQAAELERLREVLRLNMVELCHCAVQLKALGRPGRPGDSVGAAIAAARQALGGPHD
jgi:hypothetical protein